jgi:hypothetical protein
MTGPDLGHEIGWQVIVGRASRNVRSPRPQAHRKGVLESDCLQRPEPKVVLPVHDGSQQGEEGFSVAARPASPTRLWLSGNP